MKKKIAKIHNTKDILRRYNIRLNKKIGQHFLIDQQILEQIIDKADLESFEIVMEIGAGIGSLTQYLLQKLDKGQLIAIEKDSRFIKILSDLFSDYSNLKIINKDILQIAWEEFIKENNLEQKEIKVVANLPYYITTPIIENLLFSPLKIKEMLFMMQREVAKRLNANPGTKDFGSLTVFIQFHYKVEIMFEVTPNSFIPRPEVYSSVIKLIPHRTEPYKVDNKEFFFKVVRAIFNLRRKNIKNSLLLSPHVSLQKDLIIRGLKKANIDKNIRGENLSIEKMAFLSNIFWNLKKEKE